ncbi:MAG: EAL domain-containing protein [Gammaproteobacteria bacterium]|nr:EAL domain-containing protein [Gammaproteobacteria bacterium]MDH3750703.1 EAL domain-containing protein [Gammaproteobacteria bacterium]MDH3803854.1 EAL domain-containing protein [Gammaproteobacteria bacterium]
MIRSKIPRYFFSILALGVAFAAIMLSMFYGQERWLAEEITTTSTNKNYEFLRASYERRMRAQLHGVADSLASAIDITKAASVQAILNGAIENNETMTGLRFTSSDLTVWQAGSLPEADVSAPVTWLPDNLVMTYGVVRADQELGALAGSFDLGQLRADSQAFADGLLLKESQSRRESFLWIGAGTLATLILCGGIAWLIVRKQSAKIRQLRIQAEKLRDSDFGEPLLQTRGDALGELAAVFNDMRDRLRSTTISRDYVDRILSGMNEAIVVTATDGTIKRINKATTLLLGYEEDELVGTSIDYVVNKKKTGSLLDNSFSGVPKEAFFESKFGDSIPVSYTCSVVEGEGGESEDRVYAAQNITERRRAEQRIRYLARIDALTKIPNRMQFQHLLQRAIARARRAGKSLCLFYIDIDHFKDINDTFGHLAGDATLETVAERLTTALPENSVIGRLAGDEFAVIVNGLGPDGNSDETDKLARSLLDRLADPFYVQGHEVFMTASMGIAYYPQDAANVIDLIRNADAALYNAKKSGGNVFFYFVPQMNEAAVERLMTKSRLKRAFERDELLVHYQPKYNLETGEVYGAEALVRWELPDRGLILPADFIPIAEETNLIIELGEWVLDKVCEDFRLWQRSTISPERVSVNLSLKQLRQPNFINRIGSILRGHEVSPTSLELEITETTLMENPDRTIKLLDQLYALGLHLAIDDFGTGYSSLSALQQFPISTLKIDKSFVRDIATNPDDATIVGTIVQMGRNLNMDVVAEGVEKEEQLNFLQRLDCTCVQGLLFGDPMSSDNYLELLLAQDEGTNTYRALFA